MSCLHLVEAIGDRKRKKHARSLASPGGAIGVSTRHAREWSDGLFWQAIILALMVMVLIALVD